MKNRSNGETTTTEKRPVGTHSLSELIVESATSDDEFRQQLLVGAVEAVANGNLLDARLLLRECVEAGIGVSKLASELDWKTEAVCRELSPDETTSMDRLAAIIERVKSFEGVRFTVHSEPDSTAA